ncbi:MAG: hypothetical protein GY761_06220 [Hyphomicrobiales bacterium]|nr:hypothetical protein [Hyphomicrobiales bacterium]
MLFIARILLFLQIVAITGALAGIITFLGVILIANLFGASNMEGALAMGAAGIAPFGALAGGILGAWIAWLMISRSSRSVIMGFGFGFMVLAGLGVGGWFVYQELTDGNPYIQGKEPTVLIEWRLPEKVNHDYLDRIFRYTMRSSYKDWTLTTRWNTPRGRDEGEYTILRLRAKIRWRVTGRIFQLWRAPNHDDRITVDLGLPRDPEAMAEYGPWNKVKAAPGNEFRIRVVTQ